MMLNYSPSMTGGSVLPEQDSFAVIGATILDNFNIKKPEGNIGKSILDKFN